MDTVRWEELTGRSGPGWDACTGLGSIHGGALLQALTADPCEPLREDLENLSRSDFRTQADYEHAVAYTRQQLKECLKKHPKSSR